MADLKVGTRVNVKEKGHSGTVRYVGTTMFAPGKWVGVELDEPKGKNNGVVQGKTYFQCRDNHGLFVRQNQLQAISGPPQPPVESAGVSHLKKPTAGKKTPQSSPPRAARSSGSSKESPLLDSYEGKGSRRKSLDPSSAAGKRKGTSSGHASPEPSPKFAPEAPGPVSDEVSDLHQRLAVLLQKRAEDKGKIKELEKYKAQFNQMMEYKQRWSESQAELQQQLKVAKKEVRDFQLAKEKAEEELGELSDAVEMATLDKEMAEERTESLQSENEALKEKIEELTIDLEIIKQEISETGVEGAAANAQYKQLEQQNSRLKDALVRLRDLSAQDKLEHQRVVKDLERISAELAQAKDTRDSVTKELQEADAIIDELKEQVDAALGAEEMVEKLTDTNLELEEKLATSADTVTDLEALRDLSEEQEELRMEVEHELREELDMSLNGTRQVELKLDAAQESIVDQQQTIEKFRELVRHLQSDLTDLRERGERSGEGQRGSGVEAQAMMDINVQLKSAIKAQSRTIDFELRKLDAQQSAEHINLLNSFMPNSFFISGGDYDALLVLMLLPRLTFKADLLIGQLKQQHKLDEALGSLSTIKPQQSDQLAYVCTVIYKLSTLQSLVARASSILCECDVQLYRQMGGVRDDLNIHEKALDILIELLKKEQLDESVPLHGVDKAISHFKSLLETRLKYDAPISSGNSEELLSQMKVLTSGCDFLTLELLRLRTVAQDSSEFVSQVKEMESFNNDLRQACRKIRRKVPAPDSRRTLRYDSTVRETLTKTTRRQLVLVDSFKALCLKVSLRANSLTGNEKLTGGELEEFTNQVVASGTLLEIGSEGPPKPPKELLRHNMSINSTSLDRFLVALGEGMYDSQTSKSKPEAPAVLRARAVKAELSDVEGLGFKLEERQKDILELKKALKMKGQELSEAGVKIGLLEKKVDSADVECEKKVAIEKEELQRVRDIMDEQERKFNKTIEILQGDIEALENDKCSLEKRVEQQSKRTVLSDITVAGRRTLGGKGSPYSSPFGSPYIARKEISGVRGGDGGAEGSGESVTLEQTLQTPLLLSRIESLKKALGFSQTANFRLKAQIAKAQLNSLPPLRVPKKLLQTQEQQSQDEENMVKGDNQTDQEKSVLKRTAALIEELKSFSLPKVVSTSPPQPREAEVESESNASPREQLSNQIANIFEMQRRANQLKEDVRKLLSSSYPGGVVNTKVTSFASPQFSKALNESSQPSVLTARLRLPPSQPGSVSQQRGAVVGFGSTHRLVISPAQFSHLHTVVIS